MKKHKLDTRKIADLKRNVKFSKDFFDIMDSDGGGGIQLQELAQPLIALGLATDTGFVQKALKVLNPSKFGNGQFGEELTLKEFSRIFRTDPVSDKLIKLIKDQLMSNYQQMKLEKLMKERRDTMV